TRLKSAFFRTAADGAKKMAGAVAATVTLKETPGPTVLLTTTACGPGATSTGTWALIWLGDTKTRAALLPPTVTLVPLRDLGSTAPDQPERSLVTLTRLVPKMEKS